MKKQSTTLFITILMLLSAIVSVLPTMAATGDPVLINEVLVSHVGADDTEYIELFGTAGTSLDGLSLIVVESSNITSVGEIDERIDFGPGNILGSNGFYLVGNASGLQANYGVAPNIDTDPDLENDNLTVALVETSSISGSSVTGSEVVLDAVALQDPDGGTFFFDSPIIGPDGTFFPAGARRVANGVDTDTAGDWVISDFFLGSANTPTAGDTPPPPPPPEVTIYEIQYTEDPGGASPLEGQTVTTQGVVTAFFGAGGDRRFFIQDGTGPWNGLFLFEPNGFLNVGDLVQVTGAVSEFFGLTQIAFGNASVIGSAPVPDPEVLSTDAVSQEQWESVLVRVEDVTVTDDDLGFGEWLVDDNSGGVRVDDLGSYNYEPQNGDLLSYIQGPLNYSFGNFKIEPRDDQDLAPVVTVMEIQGAGHVSPYVGQTVTTDGVVTAVAYNGYYVQDPIGDEDPNTSDGIFVFKYGSKPAVGDLVELTDTVTEYIPGGAGTGNLSTTQMSYPGITPVSSGNPLPAPVIIGLSGRVPPNVDVISDDELPVNLQTTAGLFDPANDGIDFFESLEGMLVTIEDPVAVSATRTFNAFSSEMFTLPNNGHPKIIEPNNARTDRGGIKLTGNPDGYGDLHPERVQIQFDGTLFPFPVPAITVGDRLGDVTGVVGYNYGNFEVNALAPFDITPSGLEREITSLVGTQKHVTVASYNVLNLSPLPEDDDQRATLASQIVNNLGSPDVIALQEIQDNNGTSDDGTTDATLTLQALVGAIALAGGPDYDFFDMAPADGTSGGVPGGNIRNAFLYNPARVDLDGYVSLTPDVLTAAGVGDPAAFTGTRNPLAATFVFDGEAAFTVINNHLSSRFGSTPIFGGPQPFFQAAEGEREAQIQALNDYVDSLLETDKDARVIVVGDFNTFEFTDDLTEILPGTLNGKAILKTLLGEVKDDNWYTYIFDGNSQVLDHMFASRSLLDKAKFDIVHVNVDFPRVDYTVGSDHEPIVARFGFSGRD